MDELRERVKREKAAHTENDVLARSSQLKAAFPHTRVYPSLLRLQAALDQALSDVAGARVLDIGCGKGERDLSLLSKGAIIAGIDISEKYVEQARAAAGAAGASSSQFAFQVMDAHKLEFPSESFDLVVGVGVLHHLDIALSVGEVHRVLKRGGRALFFEPLAGNPLLKLFRLLTPSARTKDERPLSRGDLRRLACDPLWNFKASYCGLVCAPVAVLTSLLLRPFPKNPLLSLADMTEHLLNHWSWLAPMNQYVLLELAKEH